MSEAFTLIARGEVYSSEPGSSSFWGNRPTLRELRRQSKYMLLGSGIGVFVGIKPGGGGIIASLLSYSAARQVSSNRDNFGKGELEGFHA